jgi:hypothetical protein
MHNVKYTSVLMKIVYESIYHQLQGATACHISAKFSFGIGFFNRSP